MEPAVRFVSRNGLEFVDRTGADHRDAPGINEDPRADINDIYAFVNPKNGNIVLGMTVNPFQFGNAPAVDFSPDVLYQFKIDNDGDH